MFYSFVFCLKCQVPLPPTPIKPHSLPIIPLPVRRGASSKATPNFPISAIDLSQLHALNEPLTMAEVQEVYLPLCRLLQ